MKFYRRLTEIKAISFDLDDTLYSNKPVMQAVDKKMTAYFSSLLILKNIMLDQHKLLNVHFWSYFRHQAILKQPHLAHDVVQSRLVSYQLGFISLGLTEDVAHQQAQAAVDYFITLRSDFTVPEESKKLLANLSKEYVLIAISNGNVDTKTLGISHYFQRIYHAGWQTDGRLLKQKPISDMFTLACQQLDIKPSQLLHVGDCGHSDIQGALRAGCQTAWLSCYDVGKPIAVLPHIELNQLTQLELLLP
ncbi:HAD-IA family hydrolase [Candidatus Colwellia aromaticivorans]|uniref:HAD-IA family hydrolase n=1 Tax=Candidatus Colwellia aromaticivorans TaxID=2267621 RepID=UPI000DF3A1E6|nr:HAD-IA family hydrolase [Candidatus Colwellia aromaticivorans]